MRAMAFEAGSGVLAACALMAACAKGPAAESAVTTAEAGGGGMATGAGTGARTGGEGGAAAGAAGAAADAGAASVEGAVPCGAAPECLRFASNEAAFRWVLRHDPAILAIGEAHAQKGSEGIASATRRFTETMVPLLQDRVSDLLVEAWAGDPRCQKEVKQVATGHKVVKEQQAESNPNEYVALGTKAKALGVQPHLLRPSCDDYAGLADAGADIVSASLGLIKRLTQADATKLFQRNEAAKNGRFVVTYGGAMHNDVAPTESLRAYSFGPELTDATAGRYIELDLIVPEYVKKTPVWEKLPWFAAFQADTTARDRPTVYRLGPRSFVLVFASSPPPPSPR